MTKVLTIRSCHILIGLWILGTGLSIIPSYVNFVTLFSYDENDCRLRFFEGDRMCPQKPFEYDDDHSSIKCADIKACVKDGKYSEFLYTKETITTWAYGFLIFPILLQIIAFFSWNTHYKWLSIEVKSCWPKSKDFSKERNN